MSAQPDVSDPPDWRRVPFAVVCARCGQDLRGLQDPTCPACSLTFDWSEAVPLEELLCERCGYRLYGLEDTRCPECGAAFTWDGALAARQRRKLPFFEYHWRNRPVRAFSASLTRALRPSRLWQQADVHDRPPVKPLIGLAIVSVVFSVVLFWGMMSLLNWALVLHWNRSSGARSLSWIELFTALGGSVVRELDPMRRFGARVVLWCATSWGALMVFRQSMRIYRVRTEHVTRVWCYATAALLPWLALAISSWAVGMGILRVWGAVLGFSRFRMNILGAGGATVIVLFFLAMAIWSLRCAYEHYLGMDHAIWVAASSQVIALLVTATVILAVFTHW